MTRRNSEGVVLALLVVVALAEAQAPPLAAGADTAELDAIVARMEQEQARNRQRTQAYTVEREYQLLGEDDKLLSQVTAAVSYQPPRTKQFVIQTANGSGQGQKIVRKVLEHERVAARAPENAEVSRRNYRFRLLRAERLDGRDCFVLALEPLRKDKNLIAGEAWVDRQTFLLRRVTGTPAKSPSWWLKDVRVTMLYAPVGEGEVWLQTASHAEAKVRFFGRRALVSHNVCRPGATVGSLHARTVGCQQARF